jgi:hypothetical protein
MSTIIVSLLIIWAPLAVLYTIKLGVPLIERFIDWRLWRVQRSSVLDEAEHVLRQESE